MDTEFEEKVKAIVERLNQEVRDHQKNNTIAIYYSGNLVFSVRINLFDIDDDPYLNLIGKLKGALLELGPYVITAMMMFSDQWAAVNFDEVIE